MSPNKKLWVLVFCGASLLSLLPSGADAQKKPRPEEQEVDLVAELAATGQLLEFARKYKVPDALIDAGGVYLKVARANLKQIAEEPTVELPKGAAKEEVKVKSLTDQAEDLFDEARALATDQKAVTAKIKAVKSSAEGTRGVQGGPRRHQAALPKGATHTHRWRYKGGEPAYVCFQSTSFVQVQIFTANGVMVNQGHGLGGQAMWHPGPKDADYIVRVTSISTTTTTYCLLSN